MQLLICTCIAWFTIILFAIVPKRVSILDFVFLYCIVISLTSTSFTILELNLQIIKIPIPNIDLWAVTVFRMITTPLLILTSINALQPSVKRKRRWIMSFVILIALTTHDWSLSHFNVIHYRILYPYPFIGLAYLALILISWGLMWWYKKFDHKKAGDIS
ncbi:hypothetical protein ABE288_05580 [Bacillus salipaludis]|uniref:hypothetical protein n=1 Tax=Bacillus salipaludis TaxID=2547811 RepID=UPI003D1EE14A